MISAYLENGILHNNRCLDFAKRKRLGMLRALKKPMVLTSSSLVQEVETFIQSKDICGRIVQATYVPLVFEVMDTMNCLRIVED